MNLYELGFQTTVTAAGAALAEIVAAGRPMAILEFSAFNSAATAAARLQLGRPGNTPAGGSVVPAATPINLPQDMVASGGGVILSGQTTPPTAPVAGEVKRNWSLPATIGAAAVWSWLPGEMVVGTTRSRSLLFWNVTGIIGLQNCHIKWLE